MQKGNKMKAKGRVVGKDADAEIVSCLEGSESQTQHTVTVITEFIGGCIRIHTRHPPVDKDGENRIEEKCLI